MTSRFVAALLLALAPAVSAVAETLTLETATGPREIEAGPERVVVFDPAAIDTLEALGVPIVGVPSPIYLDYLADVAEEAEVVGTMFEPDYETLAALQPDLIVAGSRSSAQVDALSRVAPTIDMTLWGEDLLGEARARTETYAAIFSREAEADALLADFEAKIEDAKSAVAGKGNALILLTNSGKISAYGIESRFGWIHTALDLPQAVENVSDETHGEAISFEFIAQANPDWLIVVDRGAAIGASGDSAAATLDNPLVAGTTAAQKGQIIYLDAGPIYIAGGGMQSMAGTLDEIITAFSGTDS
ncbi:iron complex transport system substrate-binding protein [Poseidonocella pacifica]|uniref:Iron complex transport system substrate-binding protein n=1 Tax=Poseidonocella pacifica TaxID=871651 RepID=A0A1I0WRJ5_9RHOB|nr:siderophore ABC transporter substrate-binding protein [Poseidonocella pacifica]SFA91379.1 iron complex transport system substrate-binding protein [Poseidonocella pacifica]